jgi:polysaccharide biosynthesis/export protein
MGRKEEPMVRMRRRVSRSLGGTVGLALFAVLIAGTPPVLHGKSRAPQDIQALPVNDYRIGANDLIEIKVYELPELNQTVRVAEDGSVSLSLLGKIGVAGLTAQELESRLATILGEKFTKGEAHVTVFIKEFQKLAVIGAVGKPGMYELVGPTTLMMALAQAGGLTAQAMNEIFVYRRSPDGQQEIISIHLDDLANGKPDSNIEVRPKDVISVPIDLPLNVFVYGEVKTPGTISFLNSKKITLLQAIAQAGGPTEWAKVSKVLIKRKDKETGKEIEIRVNLKRMIGGKIADIVLEEGDVVIVP